MCGIVGVFHFGREEPVRREDLARMNELLVHRGPDEDGFLVGGRVGLAMRRLRVIDLDTGRQPIANEDGTVPVVFNGEIYNYVELRVDLKAKGHRFHTASDTKVLVVNSALSVRTMKEGVGGAKPPEPRNPSLKPPRVPGDRRSGRPSPITVRPSSTAP